MYTVIIDKHIFNRLTLKKKLRFYYSLDFKEDGYGTANIEEWKWRGPVKTKLKSKWMEVEKRSPELKSKLKQRPVEKKWRGSVKKLKSENSGEEMDGSGEEMDGREKRSPEAQS